MFDEKTTSLIAAYEIANSQQMHEHNRSLMKFNYFLAIQLALIAAVFIQLKFNLIGIVEIVLPIFGFMCALVWLLSHQRGRVCYETKTAYARFLEEEIAKQINVEKTMFLFNYFKKNHKKHEYNNLTRRWDTEQVIMILICGFIIMWAVVFVLALF